MAQLLGREELSDGHGRAANERAMRIMAKAIFRKLKTDGYDSRDVVSLSTELIGLLTSDIKLENE